MVCEILIIPALPNVYSPVHLAGLSLYISRVRRIRVVIIVKMKKDKKWNKKNYTNGY